MHIIFQDNSDMNNYPGGKGGIYRHIINRIPPHEVYIETHLGFGGILRNKRRAKRNIGIEIAPAIIKQWRQNEPLDFELIHGDAIQFLKEFSFTGREFVYCDPPYLRETRKKQKTIYSFEYSRKDHEILLDLIKFLPCMVMISGYSSELYSTKLKSWQTYSYQATCHHGVATEMIWMNYPKISMLHDYRYLGDDFREREKIKLKRERLIKKLSDMPDLERQAIMSRISNVFETKHEIIEE